MIEKVVGWIVGVYLVLQIPYLVYYNVLQITCQWRCRKKKYLKPFNPCHESDCKFAKYCDDYESK